MNYDLRLEWGLGMEMLIVEGKDVELGPLTDICWAVHYCMSLLY
jgi:hypothetical protein